jgi:hypothetical protein
MKIKNPRVENKEQSIEDAEVKTLNLRNGRGEEVPTPCVEFTVVGRNNGRRWRDFLTMEEFTSANPTLLASLINNK